MDTTQLAPFCSGGKPRTFESSLDHAGSLNSSQEDFRLVSESSNPRCSDAADRTGLKRDREEPFSGNKIRTTKRINYVSLLVEGSCDAETSDACVPIRKPADAHVLNVSDASTPQNLCCAESDVFSDDGSNSLSEDVQSPTPKASLGPDLLLPTTTKAAYLDAELTDVLKVLYATESGIPINPRYLETNHGPECNPATFVNSMARRDVVGWMVELTTHFRFHPETLFLAISLLDRFMTVAKGVPRTSLQLVATACTLVAAKHEEEKHPDVATLTVLGNNTFKAEDLIRMEAIVLSSVGFRVNAATAHSFLSLMRQGTDAAPHTAALAGYLAELALLNAEFLKMPPSHVAAAAMTLSLSRSGHGEGSAKLRALRQMLPVPLEQMKDCMVLLLQTAEQANTAVRQEPRSPYRAVRARYRAVLELGLL